MSLLHADRLFPAEPATRSVARRLYETVRELPILSPHGHTEASWFSTNDAFADPAALLIQGDHYVHRMLYSQGVKLEDLGFGTDRIAVPRDVWRIFARNFFLFRGTPTSIWLNFVFQEVFGLEVPLNHETADFYFDRISEALQTPEFRPRSLYERFRIEALATSDSPLSGLEHHAAIRRSGWNGRVVPTFRADPVLDPDHNGFAENLKSLGAQTAQDTATWSGYLAALRHSREKFLTLGCTATDHSHPTAQTANLSSSAAATLLSKVIGGTANAAEKELFRAQMITEMARMSLQDGLVMQLHCGVFRNHNLKLFQKYGGDMGGDIPKQIDYVAALKPLLDVFGNETSLAIILFTLDESTYTRELAPLAGHYPCLRLGPPWWFQDSPNGMMRFRHSVTETAGFYNTVGFNDDARSFLSIPGRHDTARRLDCSFLARLVMEHQLTEGEATQTAQDLTYNLAQRAYKL